TFLQMNKLSAHSPGVITIRGDVIIVLPPTGQTTVEITGELKLAEGASLAIYTPGNINISGAGIANPSAPQNVQIWGTAPEGSVQAISLAGSGVLSAVVYAPNANFVLPGHTDFCGAAVVRSARLTGSGSFHYDESLEHVMGHAGGGMDGNGSGESEGAENIPGSPGMPGIVLYAELETPDQREPYLDLLDF